MPPHFWSILFQSQPWCPLCSCNMIREENTGHFTQQFRRNFVQFPYLLYQNPLLNRPCSHLDLQFYEVRFDFLGIQEFRVLVAAVSNTVFTKVQSNLALRNCLVTTKKFLKVKSSLFQTFTQSTIQGIPNEESRENGYFFSNQYFY